MRSRASALGVARASCYAGRAEYRSRQTALQRKRRQAARREAAAASYAAVCGGGARRAHRRTPIPARELARGAGRANTRAAIACQGAGAPRTSACDGYRAVSVHIASGRPVATLGGLLASLAGCLALGRLRAAKHAFGHGSAGARAAVVVRLATLVFAETAARALAAPVGATHTGAAVLVLAAALGNDLAAGQRLASGRTALRHLAKSRTTVGRAATSLAGDAAAAEQQATLHALGDGAAETAAAVAIGRA